MNPPEAASVVLTMIMMVSPLAPAAGNSMVKWEPIDPIFPVMGGNKAHLKRIATKANPKLEHCMNPRSVHLISAPFCCGLSWMASVLTELNVRTTHYAPQRYPRGMWEPVPGEPGVERVNGDGLKHLGFCIPRVLRDNRFQLEPNLEVTWEHRLDFARVPGVPTLLFTRDPRDAIHSLYLRNYLPTPWNVYLDRPEDWKDHFPGMFELPPADTWAAWHAFWIGLADQGLRPLLILRYEDSKTDPVGMTNRVLDFLGVRRSEQEIRAAIAESTFEKTKVAMEQHEKATGATMRVARRGQVGEWKEFMDAESHARFSGPAAVWMRRMGYEPVESESAAALETLRSNDLAVPLEEDNPIRSAIVAWTHGGPRDAVEQSCQHVLARVGDSLSARLAVALEWVPFDWSLKVLGADAGGPLAAAALDQFRQFLRTNQGWLPVQRMLLNAVQGTQPASSAAFGTLNVRAQAGGKDLSGSAGFTHAPADAPMDVGPSSAQGEGLGEPALIDADYRGYKLYGWNGRFFAVASEIHQPLWHHWSKTEYSHHLRDGHLISAELSFELKEKVDQKKDSASRQP